MSLDTYPWKVWATHENGHKMVRVTDGAGVRLMTECGYTIDRIEEQKPEYSEA